MRTNKTKIEIIKLTEGVDVMQYERYCRELEKKVIIEGRTIVTAIDDKGNITQYNTVRGYGGWTAGNRADSELPNKAAVMSYLKKLLE